MSRQTLNEKRLKVDLPVLPSGGQRKVLLSSLCLRVLMSTKEAESECIAMDTRTQIQAARAADFD